ncbi:MULTISPECIES: hypothetical protein [Glutamicibacter]|uniref:hypothetical protein n=1 Tax=Glutamicibacter TaxID=1742989 RepID=UPI003FD3999E
MKRATLAAKAGIVALAFSLIPGIASATEAETPQWAIDEGITIVEVDPAEGTPISDQELVELEALEETQMPATDSPLYLSDAPIFQPFVSIVTCGSRIDWYRWRGQDGKNVLCFANKGEANISKYNNVRFLCPGANRGQTRYHYGNQHYWSTLRGPVSNHNTCYSFGDYAVAAKGVRIS